MFKSFSAILKQDAIFHHFITQANMETMQVSWWNVLCDVQRSVSACCSMGFSLQELGIVFGLRRRCKHHHFERK